MERDTMSILSIALLAVSVLMTVPLYAEPLTIDPSQNPTVFVAESSLDWTAGLIRAQVGLNLGAAGIVLPSGRTQAEMSLETAVPDLIREEVMAIGLDSYRTVRDSLMDGSLDASAFEAYLEHGTKTRSSLSRDLGRLTATYEWRLADLAALYVKHSRPVDLPAAERYVPSKTYTGIVVFIKGEYGVRGEHRSAAISPCLFPRLYDDNMLTIVERNVLEPQALQSWGAVAYATEIDDPIVAARAGAEPLRIMASEIFGSRRTDAVIGTEDALKILISAENRDVVRQGRIVFIIDPP